MDNKRSTDICEELRDEQHSFEAMPSSKRLCLRTNLESQPFYLNRQVITVLSTLGVKDDVFEKKQREFVQKLDASLNNRLEADEILRLMDPGENTNILKALLLCYKPNGEPFLSLMLQNFRASKLLEIRTKSQIFIHQGRSMMGCLDETRTLEYGQVVVQFSDPTRPESRRDFITGPVVVAKNPCLHPGDFCVLEAVEVPALSHMVDCIVFPQKGPRPHPNECSGSDLDGYMYLVSWDKDLIPPRTSDPMDYTPEPPHILDHDVTIIKEVEKYLSNYDSLGMIADPDLMETLDNKPRYESKNVIGKLFREVEELVPPCIVIESFSPHIAFNYYDYDMEVEGFKDYINEAFLFKRKYDHKLSDLMDSHETKTEAEILCFTKAHETVMSLRRDVLSWFNAMKGDEMAKASACYHVTYYYKYWGTCNFNRKRHHFLSFAWCVYDKLVKIKKMNEEKRKQSGTFGRLDGGVLMD